MEDIIFLTSSSSSYRNSSFIFTSSLFKILVQILSFKSSLNKDCFNMKQTKQLHDNASTKYLAVHSIQILEWLSNILMVFSWKTTPTKNIQKQCIYWTINLQHYNETLYQNNSKWQKSSKCRQPVRCNRPRMYWRHFDNFFIKYLHDVIPNEVCASNATLFKLW